METLGEYRIHRLIGEGGMGKVYEAEERLSGRRVALKVLRREMSSSEDGRRLFLGEMKILSTLDHPNVVRCLACTEVHGDLVMVLEYLGGHTLRQVLQARGRLPWQEAVRIAADVAGGLQAAHANQPPIVHRDLKPENIMILPDGRAKVMDFGIAKVLDAVRGHTTQTVGTLQYMSPEQIDGRPLDGRADLYTLGLVLYEMLAGHPPFASSSPRELLNLQVTQPPPPLPMDVRGSLPPGLEALLQQLLVKQPHARPATGRAVIERLEQIRTGMLPHATAHPTPAAATGAAPPIARSSSATIAIIERASRRGRTTALVVIGAIVLLFGVAGVGTWYVYSLQHAKAETAVPSVTAAGSSPATKPPREDSAEQSVDDETTPPTDDPPPRPDAPPKTPEAEDDGKPPPGDDPPPDADGGGEGTFFGDRLFDRVTAPVKEGETSTPVAPPVIARPAREVEVGQAVNQPSN